MNKQDLCDTYRAYIACLNHQDWPALGKFVDETVHYNGQEVGLAGYRQMLERDFRAIPDLRFVIDRLVADPPHIVARLCFDCAPTGELFGLQVNGQRVRFSEHVFYEFNNCRICNVWSVIDKAAIEAQLT